MTVAAAAAAGALALPALAGAASIPGWAAGSIALADDAVVATQSGRVDAGALRYFRMDAWRISTRAPASPTARERVVTVRTSAAPMRVAPLAARADGAFVVAAPLVRGAGPVIRCCDPETGLQDVLESDGRPGARTPVAVGITSRVVAWVTTSGGATVAVSIAAGGATVETPLPTTRPGVTLVAIDGDTVAWVDAPTYGVGSVLRRASFVEGSRGEEVPPLTLPFRPVALVAADGLVAITAGDVAGGSNVWAVRGGEITRVWRGPEGRPLVAAGGGRVVVASGRGIFLSGGGPADRVRTEPVRVRSITVDRRRIAWTTWTRQGGARVTTVRWARA